MTKAKIGALCLARGTFDFEAARALYLERKAQIERDGSVEWFFYGDLVFEPEQAQQAAEYFEKAGVDAVMAVSGTFHLGHLALIVEKRLRRPLLLWGFNELPYNGGKIRLNSVCGVNLDASNLYKAGNDTYVCHIGDEPDPDWIRAVKMKAVLAGAHFGLAGYRAHGFFNLGAADADLYGKTGVLLDHYELSDLMRGAGEAGAGYGAGEVAEIFDCAAITPEQLEKVAALTRSMESFLLRNRLDALAVRCWPEFADTYGISPCAAMSLLAAKGYTLGCEGDVEGTLSMLACNAVADEPAFLADLSQVNLREDYALMWHCGVAACPLWDKKSARTLEPYFAGGRGVTADFVMKSGPVTFMRIDSARGVTRLFIQSGTAMEMDKDLKGTYCKVRFGKPAAQVLDTVTSRGVAHHVAMIYGDYAETMRKFARIMDFETIE
ncbi:MAG TPA: fucose isomerase [Clostridiales bacterium]|nr:MAG: hypothetical protein BWY37_00303 [Firmicutes bacterium ADurb.Bin262]HOU09160.1 fucose isomerase [Clostridiales bacterium]HQH62505.1 fucose isomerase [Clostridiales bacterium]HQK73128.1 fucose isomerase [Clostridiales bacterium]